MDSEPERIERLEAARKEIRRGNVPSCQGVGVSSSAGQDPRRLIFLASAKTKAGNRMLLGL